MTPLLIRGARVVTLDVPHSERPRRGKWARDLGAVYPTGDVLVQDGVVQEVGRGLLVPSGARVIEARGRVLLPGFVDCHTHACFAGDRLDEWELKRAGQPYLSILKAGGGIMATVRMTRGASQEQLAKLLRDRLRRMLELGSTTIEVKSGYGLSTHHELKMLRAIRDAAADFPGTVVPTALLGHAIETTKDMSSAAFVDGVIHETLPAVSAEFPGIAVDAYCEEGAWSREDCMRLFDRARELGHPIRVHADQFNSLGMIEENWSGSLTYPGGRVQGSPRLFRTIDHLEATNLEGLGRLAATSTIGVVLPCAGFNTDGRYANARALVDAGGAVAVATNYNPGSAPCFSMPMAIALAVRFNKLSVEEAITAATVNAAAACGLFDRGVIAPGQRADLVLLRHLDERALAYEFGDNPVDVVIAGGKVVAEHAA